MVVCVGNGRVDLLSALRPTLRRFLAMNLNRGSDPLFPLFRNLFGLVVYDEGLEGLDLLSGVAV
jgi:hypothetical protein